jgi:hypothetical protein
MSSRGKIAVLVSGGWLYGSVNRGEFAKAIAPESHRTFRLSKHGWKAPSLVVVRGSHVDAWEWQVTAPAKRKRPAKPRRDPAEDIIMQDIRAVTLLSKDQQADLAAATQDLTAEAIAMLCIAANVNSVDDLTQATLPAFREALAGYVAGTRA